MNQIAIGDPVKGFLVLDGQAVAAPNFKATINLNYSSDDFLRESIDIEFKGSHAQLQSALEKFEIMAQRADLYDNVSYESPQYLRFQLVAGGDYYYTPISEFHFSTNPAGYITRRANSLVVTLTYTRPNYFDGSQVQVPLSGRTATDVTGWYDLDNSSTISPLRGNTVLIKKTDFSTIMPAPARFEFIFESMGAARLKDLYVGIFNHTSYDGDLPFFAAYNSLSGGTQHADAGAIEGYYRSITWSGSAWTSFTKYLIDSPFIAYFDGRSFRPILRFFNTHAYTDLYFRVHVERFGDVLYVSEPVYSPPNTGFLVLPPIDLPPNYLLREVSPARIEIALHARRLSGSSTTITFDNLTVFPLTYSALFNGFINLKLEQMLVDDSHRQRHNTRLLPNNQESVTHTRTGTDLLLFPNNFVRVFFLIASHQDLMPIAYKGGVKMYYRPRMRLI